MDVRFVEVNSTNITEYLPRILNLQDIVFKNLEKQGKQHLFFRSSKEEISEYIESGNSFVGILRAESNIISACYLTFNHSVYNDLTLYIKNSPVYRDLVLSTYNSSALAEKYMRNVSMYSMLRNQGILNYELLSSIDQKVKDNDFFENDPLRQSIAKILIDCDILNDPVYPWIKSDDLPKLEHRFKKLAKEYDKFISCFEYKYATTPKSLDHSLINLTDRDVIELDTYFSSPAYQNKGCASALINWSIGKIMSRKNIHAMSATVHPENAVSQHILHNLGFSHFCTVERRKNVLRDVMFKVLN